MKKYALHLFASIILTLTFVSASYSQTSPTSTPQTDRAALVTLCERAKDEVVASRALIASYEDTIAKLDKGRGLADAEITSLRDALAKEKAALHEKEVAEAALRKALASEVKKKNFYKRMFQLTGTGMVTAVVIGLLIL